MNATRLKLPPTVRRGEAFEIRVLVEHPMENGFRRDALGRGVPFHIVTELVARVAGREVMRVEVGSGITANPYFAFYAAASESCEVEVSWIDDRGQRGEARAAIVVTPT